MYTATHIVYNAVECAHGGNRTAHLHACLSSNSQDPACRSIAQVFLYFKGFKSIQVYRFSHVLWSQGRRDLAMVIQARNTEVFGVDIHPGARIGGGLMIDHGTGVVIGETAVVGTNCSFLHGTTLGGTGTSKDFDRHPKIGNIVFLGCGVTVLGNIKVGDHAKVRGCIVCIVCSLSFSLTFFSPLALALDLTTSPLHTVICRWARAAWC